MKYRELLSLKPHQEKAVRFGLRSPYNILAMDMGTGKTFSSLAIWNRSNAKSLLVVAPSYLLRNWEDEINRFLGPDVDISRVTSGKSIRRGEVTLISYDLASKAESLFEGVGMVISDEAHYLKSMTAKRTEALHKFIYENSIKRVSLLTGTPIKNRVSEYYSLMALMNYEVNPRTDFLKRFEDQISFADHFSNRMEFKVPIWKYGRQIYINQMKWTGSRNVPELKRYLEPFYFRVKASSVLEDSEVVSKRIQISDTDDSDLIESFEEYFSKDMTSSVRPEFKSRAAMKKVPFTIKYINDILDEVGSVVVYSDHVEPVESLAEEFGVHPITGSTPGIKRSELAKRFQEGKDKVIVATIKSFSTGVNLTKSNNMVFNDLPWVPGDLSQAIARINRIGKTKQCVIHYILGSPQDSEILGALEEKLEVIQEVV
jgi:SNF2 family DNA or RNA helicase